MRRTVETGGINWNHYVIVDIDEQTKTATIVDSYRLHKFDESQGATEHPKSIRGDIWTQRYRMKEWRDAGRPGGLEGLKKNFSYDPPETYLKVQQDVYRVV